MRNSTLIYRKFIHQIFNTKSEEEFRELIKKKRSLLFPPLDELLEFLRNSNEVDQGERHEINRLHDMLLPIICQNTLDYWIHQPEDPQKEKLGIAWLSYLTHNSTLTLWEDLEHNDVYAGKRHIIQQGKAHLQRQCILWLFGSDSREKMEYWCDYAEYFLCDVRALDLLPGMDLGAVSNLQGYGYGLWGSLFARNTKSKANYLEGAIYWFNKAFDIFTYDAYPYEWAATHLNVGALYASREMGTSTVNAAKAIEAYENALTVFVRDKYPLDWASVQNNLGVIYKNLETNKAKNVEKAIRLFDDALEVRTHEKYPELWAETQVNLGNAYGDRIEGDQNRN